MISQLSERTLKRNGFSYPFQVPVDYAVLVNEFKAGGHVQELKDFVWGKRSVRRTLCVSSHQFWAEIWTLPCEGTNVPECHPLSNQGGKSWGGGYADKRNDIRVVQCCPDDDLFAKDLSPTVNSLNPTICVTYSHDLLGRDILVKRDTLDRDFLASIGPFPNFTETTSCHNILGVPDFAFDQQLRGQYPPVCA
jgi:hypothetical protein